MRITIERIVGVADALVGDSALITERIAMITVKSASAQATYPAKRLGCIASHIPAETDPIPPPAVAMALKVEMSSLTPKNVARTGAIAAADSHPGTSHRCVARPRETTMRITNAMIAGRIAETM